MKPVIEEQPTLRSFFSFAVNLPLATFFFTGAPDLLEEVAVLPVVFAANVVSASVKVVLSAAEAAS